MAAPQCYAQLSRIEVIDLVLRLITFDQTGDDTDHALGLMRWNDITGEELRARRADVNRPFLRPVAS